MTCPTSMRTTSQRQYVTTDCVPPLKYSAPVLSCCQLPEYVMEGSASSKTVCARQKDAQIAKRERKALEFILAAYRVEQHQATSCKDRREATGCAEAGRMREERPLQINVN